MLASRFSNALVASLLSALQGLHRVCQRLVAQSKSKVCSQNDELTLLHIDQSNPTCDVNSSFDACVHAPLQQPMLNSTHVSVSASYHSSEITRFRKANMQVNRPARSRSCRGGRWLSKSFWDGGLFCNVGKVRWRSLCNTKLILRTIQ